MKQHTFRAFSIKSQQVESITVTFSAKYLPCSDTECLTCLMDNGHGPYWNASFMINGQNRSLFLGKKFNYEDVKQKIIGLLSRKPAEKVNASQQAETSWSDLKETKSSTHNLIDRIDTRKIQKKSRPVSFKQLIPPSREDFRQDLQVLARISHPTQLKNTYKSMIKKYHPDRYPGYDHMNSWMAEINGRYQETREKACS